MQHRGGFILQWAVAVCITACLITPAFAEKRVALVIGNNDYPRLKLARDPSNGQLAKAVADAEAMSETLAALGFDVEIGRNVDRVGFLTLLDRVKRKIAPGDTVFVFFAGHGVAFRGSNLLLPSDIPPVDPEGEQLIRGLAVAETDIIDAIREKGAGLAILALDACRDNPIEEFAREQARIQGRSFRSTSMRSVGLEARPTSGVFSIYSAGIGQRALDGLPGDGTERNSVFTRVFIKKLREPGRHLADVMEDVKEDVSRLAASVIDPNTRQGHRQFPAYYNETQGGRVYIAGRPTNVEPPKPVQAAPTVTTPAADEALWAVVKDSSIGALFEEFLKRHPGSRHADDARSKLRQLQPPPKVAVVAPPPSTPAPAPLAQPAVGVFPSLSPSTVPVAVITGPPLPGRAAGRKGPVLTPVGKPRQTSPDEIKLPDMVRDPAPHGVPPAVMADKPTIVHKLPGGWLTLRRDETATIYDTEGRVAASISLAPFFDKTPHRDSGLDFKRSVEDIAAAGGVLYFNVGCANTYSKVFSGKCAYLVALDIGTRKVLWQSANLTSTYGFLFAGGVLITGYGFTDEKDYIHALDPATGNTLQKTLVDSAPVKMEITGDKVRMISSNDRLYVYQAN